MTDGVVTLEPARSSVRYWQDCWRYRELLAFLAWRDIAVRYKETAIGVLWALLRPAATLTVLVVVFGRISRLPSDGVPYPVLVLSAVIPWQFIASSIGESAASLAGNASMVTRIYFPRVLMPAATVATALVDLMVSLGLLVVLLVWYRVPVGLPLLAAPLFLVLAIVLALGAGLWAAALSARYRDVRFVVPFVLQFGLLLSPVGFSTKVVPESIRLLYAMNPVVGVIEGFRWSLAGAPPPSAWALGVSAVLGGLLLASALRYMRMTERTLADVI